MFGVNGYKKIRRFGSDVHTYELSRSRETAVLEFGKKGVLEPLSKIGDSKRIITAKINFGFYRFDGSNENVGTWNPSVTTVVYTKNNCLLLVDKISEKRKEILKNNSHWYGGASYTLVRNKKIDIRNTQLFSHHLERHPRTMLGQLEDGSLFLVVVQGRRPFNRGMNSSEQAQLMLQLGCVTAVNLDGGGSSQMIVNGVTKNKPTDGRERKIGSALIVYSK